MRKSTRPLASLLLAILLLPTSIAADTEREVGAMTCNTTTQSGLLSTVLIDIVHEPHGHAVLTATGTALGNGTICQFDIEVTSFSWGNPYYTVYPGFDPDGTVSGILDDPCEVVVLPTETSGTCQARYEFDWTMVFMDPLERKQTTHLYVDFDLVVNTFVVASGQYVIYEPSVPDVLSWA